MDDANRRNFLRKAAISLAALGAFSGALPAFGEGFMASGTAAQGDAIASKTYSYTQSQTTTFIDTWTTVQSRTISFTTKPAGSTPGGSLLARRGDSEFLNLGV